MATTKPKKTVAKAKSSTKTKAAEKSAKTVKAPVVETKRVEKKTNCIKDFFARKYDANENILTIFKTPKIYGALIGEALGVMIITLIILTLGLYQPLYILFGYIGVTVAVFALSGANLNPLITVGMMASRRMSAIRGVLYMLAQVLGAWLGWVVANAFVVAGGSAVDLPVMAEVADGTFWTVTLIEFMGAIILGFFFARALQYKRSALTFAFVVACGFISALIVAIVISGSFVSLSDNFIMNPAIALIYQVLPTAGDSFGALLGDIALALVTYVVFPMLGGTLGFYISDIASKLAGESVNQ